MKRSEYSRTLRMMERVSEALVETYSTREHKRLAAEYRRMSEAIRPYTTGAKALEEDTPAEAAGERAAWAAAR